MSDMMCLASDVAQRTVMDNLLIEVSAPSLVALSAPGEQRWGFHQFPTISRLPEGRLLVTIHHGPDENRAYGYAGPALVSGDGGATWTPWTPTDPVQAMLTISHSVISPVNDGEHLCVPYSVALDVDAQGLVLPPPIGSAEIYGQVRFYRLDQCPPRVAEFLSKLPALRWTPADGRWQRDDVGWDFAEAVIRRRPGERIARPFIDNRILGLDGVLFYADYHQPYLLPDGSAPRNYAVWCMTSHDNGRSWRRLGLIAYDTTGELMMGEPCLSATSDGQLVCVIRCTHHQQKPMLITRSADRGRTWSPPQPLFDFGVMPQLLLLNSGVMALSFGRPGVHLMFSADGTARSWSGPLSLIPANAAAPVCQQSCGYTRLLATGDDRFLIVYSDFHHATDAGVHKAILVRQVTVTRRQR